MLNKSIIDTDRFNMTAHGAASGDIAPERQAAFRRAEKNPLLKNIPDFVIRQAWFTMAHLVLEKGAQILNIESGKGVYTYAMAAMNPEYHFMGIDRNPNNVQTAKETYRLPNLEFIAGDVQESFVPLHSLDAIVNSFTLHEIYSHDQCSMKAVTDALHRHLELLKEDGYIFIQGYAAPQNDDYVLMEIPTDERCQTNDNAPMNDAELLISYSENARPHLDSNYWGFYLEEMPARFPRTRLFRLPQKWAYEFLLRKAKIKQWDEELHKEYTFLTQRGFRRTLKRFGVRVLYSAPHWDNQIIDKYYNKKIRLFDERGDAMGMPETSYVLVGQKVSAQKSLIIQERKVSKDAHTSLQLSAMRDTQDGKIYDMASRGMDLVEVLPYRVTSEGDLNVFVHDGIPRSLMNAVPRNSPNIDGKRWSGHTTEAVSFPREDFDNLRQDHFPSVLKFSKEYFGLKPVMGKMFEEGPGFYPAPDFIDEHIQTVYMNAEKPDKQVTLQRLFGDAEGFSTRGNIREINAQQILDAMAVGFYPTSRLELQIMALYSKLKISYTSWSDSPMNIKVEEPEKTTKLQDILAKLAEEDFRFQPTKGSGGTLKTLQSIFVDEGQNKGGVSGLASRTVDFVINEEETLNTAVVLPLTRKLNGEVMAGVVEQYLPVPQRYKGNGYTVNCPSFKLPKDITTFEMARKFIADQFEVPLDCVAKMGESYYSHIGVTPQRIFPFAVSTAGAKGYQKVGRAHGATTYTPLYNLHRLLYLDNHYSFMKVVAMAHQSVLGVDSDLSNENSFSMYSADAKADVRMNGESITRSSSSSSSASSSSSEPSLDAK